MNRYQARNLRGVAFALMMGGVMGATAHAGNRQGSSPDVSQTPPQATLPAGFARAASIEGITEYNLSNGLKVLLIPDQSKRTITVNITYLVGSRNESYGETGMAHLLEHLMFKGTPRHPHVPDEMAAHGSAAGPTLESAAGLSNGTTWFDRTNYYETFPASESNLEWAIGLEADRMINSFISKKDLDSEMTVVRNEMESDDNDPVTVLKQQARAAAYQWHNYAKDTLGARSDIENVPITRLQAFYHWYYQPDNAVLIVAGKFERSKALSLIAGAFGVIPKPPRTIQPSYTVEPPQEGEREVIIRKVADTQAVAIGYHIPAGSHPDMAAVQILSRILTDFTSGRLYKALNGRSQGTIVGGEVFFQRDPGMAFFTAQAGKQTPVDEVRSQMIQTIEEMTAAPSQEEVDRARTALLASIAQQSESTTATCIALSEWIAMGDWRLLFVYRDELRKVTPAGVARVARRYFRRGNRTVAVLIPTDKPDPTGIPATPAVEALVNGYKSSGAAVSEGEAFDPTPANIKARLMTASLPDGLELALLPKKTRGATVAATLELHFGDADSLRNQTVPGLLAQFMLSRGTSSHTAQEIQDQLNKLHAQVRPNLGGPGGVSLAIQTTRENLPQVLALVADMVRHPSFPPDEFQKFRGLVATALASQRSQPTFITQQAYAKYLSAYEPGDPRYPMSLDELTSAFKTLSLDDLKSFHDRFYGASNSELAVVGDFDPDEVKQQAVTLFGGWKSPQPFTRLSQTYKEVPAVNNSFETPDKPGASYIAAVTIKLSQEDGDYPALVLANYIIGGGFLNSRLEKRIRGKEGLAYSVSSSLTADPRAKGALFTIAATCAPQNMSKVETAAREEMDRILKEGFSAEDVEAAKAGYMQAQTVNLANDSTLAATLIEDMYLGRTIEWDANLDKQIVALKPDQILAAIRRYIDPAKLSVFKAGDFAKNAVK